MNNSKNYITFVNDHSGSMSHLARSAIADYNTITGAFKDAASREMLDTIVSVIGIGMDGSGFGVKRQVVISNPHVLKPITHWPTPGGTPLYDGIGEAIELNLSLPDADDPNVSFLVITTTDGEETHSRRYNETQISRRMRELQATGRWTFVFRVPTGASSMITKLGIPAGNVQEWGTSKEGMEKSTAQTTAAVNSFYAARSAGQKSSTVFYAQAAAVNTSALVDITKDVSLYVVDQVLNGIEIRDFVLRHRMEYLKGSAFYQLTKTEARVQPEKIIAVRDRTTGKIYAGKEARQMLGLPTDKNVRLHPGDHGNFDLFIQSSSVNRKLVGGTGVIYWKAIGKPFTEADLAYLQPKPVAPAVVQLPAVTPTNKPTPSPLKKMPAIAMPPAPVASVPKVHGATTPRVFTTPQPIIPSDGGRVRYHTAPMAGATFFASREVARYEAGKQGKKAYDAGPNAARNKRHYIA